MKSSSIVSRAIGFCVDAADTSRGAIPVARGQPRGTRVNPRSRRTLVRVECHNDRTVFDVRCGWLRSRCPTLDFCRPCLEPLAAWWAEPQSWTTVATPASLFPSEASA